ncbi:hypothetical protein TVAG_497050 [Trichomonas vaginalis G3]|uniref:Uncharacterized protein n=1 Tax=Trichomonas vaginalis (strain ATCC PRA-98 / G3) TaxID=412133 RepID=A2EGU8_TRIV3|nr:hypothetical protein TVAG_497050 [Trichomonas vaginalis G3]|eukprot:XP_001320305.1 hypothetical protein [Trichomonas vaginalis G3]
MISTIGTTTIQTTSPNSLVMNPTSMLVEMKSFIPSSYTFETEIQKIKQELLTCNLDCSAKDETNEQYLYEMQDLIDHFLNYLKSNNKNSLFLNLTKLKSKQLTQ